MGLHTLCTFPLIASVFFGRGRGAHSIQKHLSMYCMVEVRRWHYCGDMDLGKHTHGGLPFSDEGAAYEATCYLMLAEHSSTMCRELGAAYGWATRNKCQGFRLDYKPPIPWRFLIQISDVSSFVRTFSFSAAG